MKRIIKAARDKADILKRRDEYRAEYESQKKQAEEEIQSWMKANREILSAVEQEVLSQLGNLVEPLHIDVTAEFRWGDKVEVSVRSNEHRVHDKDKALSWTFTVCLNRQGEIVKESNSWSGLNAVTEQQISSLRMSVEALEILNKIDWESALDKEEPDFEKYVKTNEPKNRDAEFARELDEADVENAIESGNLILGKNDSGKLYRGVVYYVVMSETPKQYKVVEVPERYIDYLEDGTLIGITEGGYVTTSEESIFKKWTSIRDVIEWAKTSAMAYNITKDKFFDNIERPVQIL